MNNFKVIKNGSIDLSSHNYGSLTIQGLKPNYTYVMFAALYKEQNGQQLYSLKEETLQVVLRTLCRNDSNLSAWTQRQWTGLASICRTVLVIGIA